MQKFYVKVYFKGETPEFVINAVDEEGVKEKMQELLPDCEIMAMVKVKRDKDLQLLMEKQMKNYKGKVM